MLYNTSQPFRFDSSCDDTQIADQVALEDTKGESSIGIGENHESHDVNVGEDDEFGDIEAGDRGNHNSDGNEGDHKEDNEGARL